MCQGYILYGVLSVTPANTSEASRCFEIISTESTADHHCCLVACSQPCRQSVTTTVTPVLHSYPIVYTHVRFASMTALCAPYTCYRLQDMDQKLHLPQPPPSNTSILPPYKHHNHTFALLGHHTNHKP